MEYIIVLIMTVSSLTNSDQYDNLALNKRVTVSKRYNLKDFDPGQAIGGDISTELLIGSLTASGENEAWLTVDLGEAKNIASISFLHGGRGDTLAGFSVYVSDSPDWKSGTLCYQHDINKPVENNVNIDCFTTGRYFTIYNSRNGSLDSTLSTFEYINIFELNITGCDIGHYGYDCLECLSRCINYTCQMQVGHCFDCENGFTGSMCEEAALDTNAGYIVTIITLVIVLIGILLYIMKRKWYAYSKQIIEQNYEIPTPPKKTNVYEVIRNKNTTDESDNSAYSEIGIASQPVYINIP